MTRAAIILCALYLLMAFYLSGKAEAHVPLKYLTAAHCMVETQHLPERLKDTAIGPENWSGERARGRCQIMPSTAEWLAKKFKWEGPYDLELKEHSRAFGHLRLITCETSLYRRFRAAPQRSISWCYLSGRISLRTPQRGFYARYLDQIGRKMEWVRRNQTNWMAWKIIKEGDRG